MKKRITKKAVIIASVCFCVGVLILFIFLSFFNDSRSQTLSDGTIVRKNVSVITNETETKSLPIEVNDNNLVFGINPRYPKGEVIVAGITPVSPYGFIRKVIETKKEGDRYVVETDPGLLTDVFKEAHVVKIFDFSETEEIVVSQTAKQSLSDIVVSNLAYVPNNKAMAMTSFADVNGNVKMQEKGD